ncbi:GyrI-like domain-containing protein [Paenibacillus paeoniae]|uniref:AraC effector-binding domain-containing protein n=1 Tax=Paenibacillus paeoniae TaxID=2292705 RepID=A0A371PM20_9BACL|nr:GyrI-like domain-containing protein [Paenibacillus paeoniae]REK77035.1 hypothetical protein DX130_08510 [Paenibacillus paeoniae]
MPLEQITMNRSEIKLVGYRVHVSLNQDLEENIVVNLREEMTKQRHHISNQTNAGMYLVQIYPEEEWTPDVPFTSLVAVEVSEYSEAPEGCVTHTIPSGQYVKVTHKGPESDIGEAYDWIREQDICSVRSFDFEYWAPKASFDEEDSMIDIYLPVEE